MGWAAFCAIFFTNSSGHPGLPAQFNLRWQRQKSSAYLIKLPSQVISDTRTQTFIGTGGEEKRAFEKLLQGGKNRVS
jgi:hypothetical protein